MDGATSRTADSVSPVVMEGVAAAPRSTCAFLSFAAGFLLVTFLGVSAPTAISVGCFVVVFSLSEVPLLAGGLAFDFVVRPFFSAAEEDFSVSLVLSGVGAEICVIFLFLVWFTSLPLLSLSDVSDSDEEPSDRSGVCWRNGLGILAEAVSNL